MKNIKQNCYLLPGILVLALCLLWPPGIQAESGNISEEQETIGLPAKVEAGLSYLLGLVNQKGTTLDAGQVVPLLDFALRKEYDPEKIRPAKRRSGKGITLRVEVMAPLERILRYAFNPDIPGFVLYPRVLRLSDWYPNSEIVTGNVQLWNKLDDLAKPFLLRGKEFEVNTPDSFGGAYYRYDLNRLIGLMKHKKGRVLISVSKMNDKSQVGKKAVIIDDNNWNYFYSGIDGLNLKIIGALETYMYDSESVIIYYQEDVAIPRTTVLLFKWLKAGWMGINVVKPNHIYEGCTRFAEGLRAVLEAESLPSSEVFVELVNYVNTLSDSEIDSKIREYSSNFERLAKSHKEMAKPDYARIIANGGYAGVLNREERVGILILEGLKNYIGKPALVTLEVPSRPKETLSDTESTVSPDQLSRISH